MYNVWYSVIWYDGVRHDVKRSKSMQNTNGYNWTEVISIQYQNSRKWQAGGQLRSVGAPSDRGHRTGQNRIG